LRNGLKGRGTANGGKRGTWAKQTPKKEEKKNVFERNHSLRRKGFFLKTSSRRRKKEKESSLVFPNSTQRTRDWERGKGWANHTGERGRSKGMHFFPPSRLKEKRKTPLWGKRKRYRERNRN